MIKQLIAFLLEWKKRKNFNYACRKANYLQAKTFKKHYVFLFDGKFVVVERQHLKSLAAQKAFKNGANLRQIEAIALYQTTF